MPPVTIHCVRHAQGFHNISVANHAIHDPMLTPAGEEQCRILQKVFPFMSQVDCVVASPLIRTMYTALLSFEPVIKDKNLRVIALPELQETSDLPCDTGSEVKAIEVEFKDKPVDLGIMYTPQAKDWNSKKGKWASNTSAIDERARQAREWLYNRPEKEIVAVTHGGFLHYLTEDWNTPSAGTGWANTEFRSYHFDTSKGRVSLIETPESRNRRMGTEKPLSKEEQKNLQRAEQKEIVEQDKQDKAYQKATSIQAKV